MSSTDILLAVATAAQLFHATDGTPFADLVMDGHRETWPVRSKRFRAWSRQQYYERTWGRAEPWRVLTARSARSRFRLAEHDGLI